MQLKPCSIWGSRLRGNWFVSGALGKAEIMTCRVKGGYFTLLNKSLADEVVLSGWDFSHRHHVSWESETFIIDHGSTPANPRNQARPKRELCFPPLLLSPNYRCHVPQGDPCTLNVEDSRNRGPNLDPNLSNLIYMDQPKKKHFWKPLSL